MTPQDWLVCIDDMLTERFPRCLQCGHGARWMDTRLIRGRATLVCLCGPCKSADHDWRLLEARLQARAREGEA